MSLQILNVAIFLLFFLRGHNWVHFAHSVLLLEFKFYFIKNLTLFSIREKKLFVPVVLRKKATGFCSFYKHFLEKPIFE